MLVDKTVSVEKEVSDVMAELVVIVTKIKAGETVLAVLSEEIGTLVKLVSEVPAIPADFGESFDGALRAAALASVDLVSALLGKKVEA